jgi:polyisoprenoid-binding protein YceI
MKNLSQIILIASLGLASGPVMAKDAKTTTETKTKVETKTKKTTETVISSVEGQVKWTGYGVGKSHGGTVTVKSGEVKLTDDVLTHVAFVLDMNSLHSPDSEKLTGHLKNADFFDVAKYPEAQFKSTEIKLIKQDKAKGPNYEIKGLLTIKGKEKPFEFKASVSNEGKNYLGLAETQIVDRTQFGIEYNSDKFTAVSKLGDKLIKNNIDLQIQIKTK